MWPGEVSISPSLTDGLTLCGDALYVRLYHRARFWLQSVEAVVQAAAISRVPCLCLGEGRPFDNAPLAFGVFRREPDGFVSCYDTVLVLDWLLFSPKGTFRSSDPVLWLLAPLGYFGYILVRSTFAGNIGTTDSQFPYGFIDPAVQGGWGEMFWGVAFIAIGMAILGYAIYTVDWLLRRKSAA